MRPDATMATDQNHIMNHNDTTASQTLTLRMLMQGKEVGSIIGKKGDNVKKYREESGAKINISDASCPERIVTVTGISETIVKAFTMICNKFEEDILATHTNNSVARPPVTVRLIIPASQCGSLIGKGGAKIKEIRESTGASVQVASEMLPNSTERTVTMSGSAEAIVQCIYHICSVMLESPPKGATIPYRPKPVVPPVLLAGGQAYALPQGQFPVPTPPSDVSPAGMAPVHGQPCQMMMQAPVITDQSLRAYWQPDKFNPLSKLPHQPGLTQGALPIFTGQQVIVPGMHGLIGGAGGMVMPRAPVPAQAANNNTQSHEMIIPNEIIGCVIGKGGSKINEIRQISGATIKISNIEEGSTDRKVTITGAPETVNLAQYLITTSMELHKNMTLDPNTTPTSTSLTSTTPPLVPLSQLVKPSLPYFGLNMGVFDATKALTTKIKGPLTVAPQALPPKKVEKFTPY